MRELLLVMAGGAVGSAFRYLTARGALAWWGPHFPWGTLIVNVVGGFAMGLVATIVMRAADGEPLRLLLGVGLLGGFTTFSAFSLESAMMIERGQVGLAAAYTAASVIGSILALFAGLYAGRATA